MRGRRRGIRNRSKFVSANGCLPRRTDLMVEFFAQSCNGEDKGEGAGKKEKIKEGLVGEYNGDVKN